jgi:hypothetical protein
MKERPILFSGPMVRAILEGRKTQTRRVVGPKWNANVVDARIFTPGIGVFGCDASVGYGDRVQCPYGVPGDRMWVRETWAPHDDLAASSKDVGMIYYRADDENYYSTDGRWRPSIHMPRWASRITLEITDVRVQRLQEIDYLDAMAEGIPEHGGNSSDGAWRITDKFRELWESINAKRCPWSSNPWVWAITFKSV